MNALFRTALLSAVIMTVALVANVSPAAAQTSSLIYSTVSIGATLQAGLLKVYTVPNGKALTITDIIAANETSSGCTIIIEPSNFNNKVGNSTNVLQLPPNGQLALSLKTGLVFMPNAPVGVYSYCSRADLTLLGTLATPP